MERRQTGLTKELGPNYSLPISGCETILKVAGSFAFLRISVRGSDAAQAPQLAEKILTLYTENFHTKEYSPLKPPWGGEDEWVGPFFFRLQSLLFWP
jgi:hypothetical protein